jgi:hypothetical protein
MYARVAQFEGLDRSRIDELAEGMKRQMDATRSGGLPADAPPEATTLMETVKRFVSLVDRDNGTAIGISFCESADDVRRADEALNTMLPPDGGGRRTTAGIYEVMIDESFQ